MKRFKNLVFDLGNVIVDIEYDIVVAEFQKIATVDFAQIVSLTQQHPIFDLLETGKITPHEFRQSLRKFLKPEITDKQIVDAWNAIFIAYPEEKFKLLKELKTKYRTYALSNINQMHADFLDEVARTRFEARDFASFFNRAFYSHELGFRKPDKKIYEALLNEEKLNPSETFFIDDKEENIATAKSLGIHAHWLKSRNDLQKVLAAEGII